MGRQIGELAAALQTLVTLALAAAVAGQTATTPTTPTTTGTAPESVPSTAFLDQYAAVLSSTLLIKNHKDTAAATADAVLIADTARKYVAALAAKKDFNPPNILTAIASSNIYQIIDNFGNSLAQLLPNEAPNHKDHYASNYTQSVLPGLTTALTGLSYSPCLLQAEGVGAIAGATGVGISPKIFSTGPVGAAAVAEAISIAPVLLYDTQAGAEAVAVGLDIAPTLISVSPAKYIYIREGLSASPIGLLGIAAPAGTSNSTSSSGPGQPGPLPPMPGPDANPPGPP